MASITSDKGELVRDLYCNKKFSMKQIADKIGVSIDAVAYYMRKNGIERRSAKEANSVAFGNKPMSFSEVKNLSPQKEKLKIAGLMLYWCEGYKTSISNGIDFANSDPEMIQSFVYFLREIYKVDEKRFRILLYCYSDQNIPNLINFWSKLTGISKKQFTQPYVRNDFKKYGRKMKYGMVHIRYADKKLFLSIMESIEQVKLKMRRSYSGNYSWL